MRGIQFIDLVMKWLGGSVLIAGTTCLHAQAQETTTPPIRIEQIQELLRQSDVDVEELATKLLGDTDTNSLFYFPTHDAPATPAKWGFNYDDVEFESTDGTKLHGWFLSAKGKLVKGTIVFSHGNAGSIGHHLGFAMWLVEAGYNVFMYDYRGFGKSGGKLDREGMVEDVKGAFAYVAGRPDVDAGKLVSYGHSLGGAKSVTALAQKRINGIRAIVIDGTFASYKAMARLVGGEYGAKLISDELSPKDFIAKITDTPLLIVHGDRDQVVPVVQGKELFELANEPKTLFEVKGGSHGNSLARDEGAYRKRMLAWLDAVM